MFAALSLTAPQVVNAGAWGPGSFENDGALDWVLDFKKMPTLDIVRATLEQVMIDGVIDSLDGQAALAAAEVVSTGLTGNAENLPSEIRSHVAALAQGLKQLAPLALAAVQRVAGQRSELNELWDANEESRSRWQAQVKGLLHRLNPPAKAA